MRERSKSSKSSAKQAPIDLPKKQRKKARKSVVKTCFYVLALLCLVFASVITAQIIMGVLMLFLVGRETFYQPVPTAIYSALSYILALAIIVVLSKLTTKARHTEDDGTKKSLKSVLGLRGLPTWTDIGLAPAGYIVYLILAFVLTFLFSLFPWFNAGEAQDVGFSVYIFGFDRVVAFITLVVIAPIAEELIFRGWLYSKLRSRLSQEMTNWGSIIITSLLVSLLFGIVHLQWNVGVNVFALSLVLCAMREITGTVYSGILLHMLKNGIAFYLLFIIGM